MTFPRNGIAPRRNVNGVMEKLCGKCNQWHPLTTDFWGRNRTSTTGWQSWCKNCMREATGPHSAKNYYKKLHDYIERYANRTWPRSRKN